MIIPLNEHVMKLIEKSDPLEKNFDSFDLVDLLLVVVLVFSNFF